jgi:multimeric flavodoxin WrbA
MQKIYPFMQESAGLIVATPAYSGGVTAQKKTCLDRLFPYIGMNLSPKLPISKKVSIIFTQKQPDVFLLEKPITQFRHMVALTGFSLKDYLIAYDLDSGVNQCVTGKKEFMEKAYQIGKDLLT